MILQSKFHGLKLHDSFLADWYKTKRVIKISVRRWASARRRGRTPSCGRFLLPQKYQFLTPDKNSNDLCTSHFLSHSLCCWPSGRTKDSRRMCLIGCRCARQVLLKIVLIGCRCARRVLLSIVLIGCRCARRVLLRIVLISCRCARRVLQRIVLIGCRCARRALLRNVLIGIGTLARYLCEF